MRIGIIVALDSELECMKRLFSECREHKDENNDFFIGKVGLHDVILTKSGIGKVCAAARTLDIIYEFSPNYIINTGLAGGISSTSRICDVVVGNEIAYHDVWCGYEEDCKVGQIDGYPQFFLSDEGLISKILSDKEDSGDKRVYSGLICSGDRFITCGEELQKIKDNFPKAVAVDMESAAIAHVCYMRKTPFLSLRVISDTPSEENNMEQYDNFWDIAPKQSFDILKHLIEKL